VIVAVGFQIFYANKPKPVQDPTFDLWPMWICTQLVQALAIITACVPYLKPFMDSLESGGFRADDQKRKAHLYGSNPYGSGKYGTGGKVISKYTVKPSPPSPISNPPDRSLTHDQILQNGGSSNEHKTRQYRPNAGHELGVMRMGHGATVRGGSEDDDIQSQSSQVRLPKRQMLNTYRQRFKANPRVKSRIIKETRTFAVEVETRR
jgi:hypothetical protein